MNVEERDDEEGVILGVGREKKEGRGGGGGGRIVRIIMEERIRGGG